MGLFDNLFMSEKMAPEVKEQFKQCDTLDEVIEVFRKNYDTKNRRLTYLEKATMTDQIQQAIDFMNIQPLKNDKHNQPTAV